MSNETRSCRLCDENNDQMYNIFDKNVFDIQIINMIKDCLPILIYRSDPLSKFICHSCNENLNMFCEFKKSSLDIAQKHKEDLIQNADNDPKVMLYLKQLEDEKLDNVVTTSSLHMDINEDTSDTLVDDSRSQDASSITSQISTNCNNNENTSESDMEIDDTMPQTPAIEEQHRKFVNYGHPIVHKPRITGPKSMTNTYTKLIETDEIVYQPLSLEDILVRYLNMQNIPGYSSENWKEQIRTVDKLNYCCRYCEEMFEQENKLAIHEMENHIRLNMIHVDKGLLWNKKQEDYKVRNKWRRELLELDQQRQKQKVLEANHVDIEGADDDNEELLVPLEVKVEHEEKVRPIKVIQPPLQQDNQVQLPVLDVSRNSRVYFVDEVPYVDGVPLKEYTKEVRNTFYQGVRMYGAKRKFCQLCRHTFKDNWAIENHYITGTCYYTCNYCGQKFKRSKPDFLPHIEFHKGHGHELSTVVFQPNERGEIREYDTGCLELYVPPNVSNNRPPALPVAVATATPPRQLPKPTQMTLRVRVVTPKHEPIEQLPEPPILVPLADTRDRVEKEAKLVTVDELAKNQAYFCKKCYQVFTKLDSYNTHTKTCKGEIDDPEMSLIRHYNKKDGSSPLFCTKVRPPQNYRRNPSNARSRSSLPQLKPIGQHMLAQSMKIKQEVKDEPQPLDCFPCGVCSAVFKTIYSRNSHMRMHAKPKAVSSSVQVSKGVKRPTNSPLAAANNKKVKHENFEPIVEIHEVTPRIATTIGSVSITPLKKPAKGGALNVSADIMKLVQNNPNITFNQQHQIEIRSGNHVDSADSSQSSDEVDPAKGYKCAFCTQWFGNKSTLYFHKKNTCNGSRYPCPFCKKRFATANEYSSHIFYSHPE